MPLIRVVHNKNYTVISNEAIRDKKLSLKAKGLHHLLLSYSDNFSVSIKGLESLCKESRDAISSAINELIKHGYIIRNKINNGRIKYDYTVYESPMQKNQSGNSVTVNPNLVNTNKVNTNKVNTNTTLEEIFSKFNLVDNSKYPFPEFTAKGFTEFMIKSLSKRYSDKSVDKIIKNILLKILNDNIDGDIQHDINKYKKSLNSNETINYYSLLIENES